MFNNVDNIEELKLKGNICFKEKRYEEAHKYYCQAINICSDKKTLSALYSNMSNTLIQLKKYEESEENAKKCIEESKEWYKGYLRLATAQFYLKKFDLWKTNTQIAIEKAENEEQIKEINNLKYYLNKQIKFKDKLNYFLEDEYKKPFEDSSQVLVDWLMSQFIKPYEDDAFRTLGEYYNVKSSSFNFTDLDARQWLDYGIKYGSGDSPELFKLLQDFLNNSDMDSKQKIYKLITKNYL
jgi:tetratricopeptide (TPR) repeat protein